MAFIWLIDIPAPTLNVPGVRKTQEFVHFELEKGIPEGATMILEGRGHQLPGVLDGDVIIEVLLPIESSRLWPDLRCILPPPLFHIFRLRPIPTPYSCEKATIFVRPSRYL